jgi:arabinan endo-1,5-alpha-L-arabinosidase
LWGEGELRKTEVDASSEIVFQKNGKISGNAGGWKFGKDGLTLMLNSETITNLIVFNGHDWENETETLLFTGLDKNGCSVWGKKLK